MWVNLPEHSECELIVLDANAYLLEQNAVIKDSDELYTGLGKKSL